MNRLDQYGDDTFFERTALLVVVLAIVGFVVATVLPHVRDLLTAVDRSLA